MVMQPCQGTGWLEEKKRKEKKRKEKKRKEKKRKEKKRKEKKRKEKKDYIFWRQLMKSQVLSWPAQGDWTAKGAK